MVWATGLHSDRRPAGNLKFGVLLKDSMQGFNHPFHTAFRDSYPHHMIFCIKDLLIIRKAKECIMLLWLPGLVVLVRSKCIPCLNIDLQGFGIYRDRITSSRSIKYVKDQKTAESLVDIISSLAYINNNSESGNSLKDNLFFQTTIFKIL